MLTCNYCWWTFGQSFKCGRHFIDKVTWQTGVLHFLIAKSSLQNPIALNTSLFGLFASIQSHKNEMSKSWPDFLTGPLLQLQLLIYTRAWQLHNSHICYYWNFTCFYQNLYVTIQILPVLIKFYIACMLTWMLIFSISYFFFFFFAFSFT